MLSFVPLPPLSLLPTGHESPPSWCSDLGLINPPHDHSSLSGLYVVSTMKSPIIYLEIYQYFLIGSFRKADYNVASGTEGISLNFILKLLIYFDYFPTSLKA